MEESPKIINSQSFLEISDTQESSKISDAQTSLKTSDLQDSHEYQQFLLAGPHLKKLNTNIREVSGNLFDSETIVSLVHCVSADFKMTRGIALTMRKNFGNIKQLQKLNKQVTDIATSEKENSTILFLITKKYYLQKSLYQNLFKIQLNLKKLSEERNITRLAYPRLGCGLNGLKRGIVLTMLNAIFQNSKIKLTVVVLESFEPFCLVLNDNL